MMPDIVQCDACTKVIPSDKPRLQCLTCQNYDLCANCALGGKFTGEHHLSHQTQIYVVSGGRGVLPVVSDDLSLVFAPPGPVTVIPESRSARSPPPVPNRRSVISPPPLPPRRVSAASDQHGRQASTSPTLPPPPPTTNASTSPPPAPRQTSLTWSALFDGNMNVTAMGEMLLAAVFTHLDTSYSGYLSPEAYSGFLDDQGYQLHENVWKANLIQDPVYGQSKENVADKALKNAYDLFSIEHVLHDRFNPPGSTQPSMSSQLFSLFAPGLNVNTGTQAAPSKMPLLTLKGFIDITAVELLSDPSKGWGNLQRALKKYRLSRFEGWGDLPRHVLPEYPDARMLQRVKKVSEFAKARDEQLLASSMAEMKLRKQGRQNALDLLDDRRYYY